MDKTIVGALIGALATLIGALLSRQKVVAYRIQGKEREFNLGALLFLMLAFFGGAGFLALGAYRLFGWMRDDLSGWINVEFFHWLESEYVVLLRSDSVDLLQTMTSSLKLLASLFSALAPLFEELAVPVIFAAATYFGGLACASYIDPRLRKQ